MSSISPYLSALLRRLRQLREEAHLSRRDMEDRLILGPGWIDRFESGETTPSLDILLAMLHLMGKTLPHLVEGLPEHGLDRGFDRNIRAEQVGSDVVITFRYAAYDATYTLVNATTDEFDQVIKTLRDGLSRLIASGETDTEAIKRDSVARAFLTAVKAWPHANPSDLWWFIIYRAYCDPFNHPAQFARLDLGQSWKRTGGWALEEVLVRHYGPLLKQKGVNLFIGPAQVKERLLSTAKIRDRLEIDKIDVLLTGDVREREEFFGVVHVKSSFAERRTDDVPMSRALIKTGYTSPLWTMDCKSTPSQKPVNRGELGPARVRGRDQRSAKRKDIEKDAYFSACFSYNANTVATPSGQRSKARVYVCDFNNPDDAFSEFILQRWQKWRST